ncbi:MAG: hypothetical protein HIU86_11480 [Acidobacteria bacterium]|nr:hypothetical protein [Acidobacteriota bacterium]
MSGDTGADADLPDAAAPTIRHVLIHANGEDPASLATALRVARQSAIELPSGTRFHVVVQGPLVRLLTAGGESAEDVTVTVSDTVSVAACRNSMDRAGVSEQELLSAVGTVASAGAYLATRQWEGWAYLRY